MVVPCMLTTHLASWLVSRALKGRTLTATFTEAPAIVPDTLAFLSWRAEKEEVVRAAGGPQTSASPLLPGTSLSTASPAPRGPLGLLPNVTVPRDSRRCSCPSPLPHPSSQGPGPSSQSYLVSRPQTRGAVSALAPTGPRGGSPILHSGPGHTSWGCGGKPGCGGRVVRSDPCGSRGVSGAPRPQGRGSR